MKKFSLLKLCFGHLSYSCRYEQYVLRAWSDDYALEGSFRLFE